MIKDSTTIDVLKAGGVLCVSKTPNKVYYSILDLLNNNETVITKAEADYLTNYLYDNGIDYKVYIYNYPKSTPKTSQNPENLYQSTYQSTARKWGQSDDYYGV